MSDGISLKQSGRPLLNFKFYINNPDFDKDDNPYGTILFHMYTNMDNIKDKQSGIEQSSKESKDIIVPIVNCDKIVDSAWKEKSVNHYCPDFKDEHFLAGSFYSSRFAWMRLAIHFCDDSPEAEAQRLKDGKKHIKCLGKEKTKEFFQNNIIGLDMTTYAPTLGDSSLKKSDDVELFDKVLQLEYRSIEFSSKQTAIGINYRSIGLSQS